MVSIIMAAYNMASTLPRAVESVLSQTYTDWELILIDDGSTDETPRVVAGLTDPRIRAFRHSPNRGVTAAKNAGFDQIKGEWFTILDADDEIVPEALATMLECAEETGATAITCNCMDSVTGEMSGFGPVADGWLSADDAAKISGEHWGLTRTELLGTDRFDERLPQIGDAVWLKIDARARRYYLHRALRIYHTEGTDRVSVAGPRFSIRQKANALLAVGEDREYLVLLKAHDATRYRRTIRRIRAARMLRPFL
jgi:GalNAc5-diNAcBac-PP-undecaprenol beta-1,3-glucosyltransferase